MVNREKSKNAVLDLHILTHLWNLIMDHSLTLINLF